MASDIAPNLSQLRPALARPPRLPDLLTTANLACGVLSVLLASQGQLTIACGLIFLAAVFDVFDGLAARALGGGSPLGTQLDSLADMVSFGVAPAFIAAIHPPQALRLAISVHRDFLPSSWGMYYPTRWDFMTFFGTIGLFLTLFMLFLRFVPMIAIFEVKTLLPQAKVKADH